MSEGRRAEIDGWTDFLEQLLPWIALFDASLDSFQTGAAAR